MPPQGRPHRFPKRFHACKSLHLCMSCPLESLNVSGAYRLSPVSVSCPPSDTALEPRPLSSTGVTRLLRYYGPLRHPDGPGFSSRIPSWRVPRHRRGFPCCYLLPLVHMPPPLPRRNRPVLASLASRPLTAFPVSQAGRLPHCPFRGLLSVHCTLRPADSLSRLMRPFGIGVLQSNSLPP